MPKPIWQSKTFWFNVLSAGAAVLNGPAGAFVPPTYLAAAVAGINVALRLLTVEPASLTGR